MDNSNASNGKDHNDGREDREYGQSDALLVNHLARLRLSHSPVPLWASPPNFPPAQPGPAANFFLTTRERQFIYRWLDEVAFPENW